MKVEFSNYSASTQAGVLQCMGADKKARMMQSLGAEERSELLSQMSDGGATMALLPPGS